MPELKQLSGRVNTCFFKTDRVSVVGTETKFTEEISIGQGIWFVMMSLGAGAGPWIVDEIADDYHLWAHPGENCLPVTAFGNAGLFIE